MTPISTTQSVGSLSRTPAATHSRELLEKLHQGVSELQYLRRDNSQIIATPVKQTFVGDMTYQELDSQG